MGQGTLQADSQEQALGAVKADGGKDFAVGQSVLTCQQFHLQQKDTVQGRTSKTLVGGFKRGSKGLEVDNLQETSQVMVLRDNLKEPLPFGIDQREQSVRSQHGSAASKRCKAIDEQHSFLIEGFFSSLNMECAGRDIVVHVQPHCTFQAEKRPVCARPRDALCRMSLFPS